MISKRIKLVNHFEGLNPRTRQAITEGLKAGTLNHLPIDLLLCFTLYLRPEVVASLPTVPSPLSLDASRE